MTIHESNYMDDEERREFPVKEYLCTVDIEVSAIDLEDAAERAWEAFQELFKSEMGLAVYVENQEDGDGGLVWVRDGQPTQRDDLKTE